MKKKLIEVLLYLGLLAGGLVSVQNVIWEFNKGTTVEVACCTLLKVMRYFR